MYPQNTQHTQLCSHYWDVMTTSFTIKVRRDAYDREFINIDVVAQTDIHTHSHTNCTNFSRSARTHTHTHTHRTYISLEYCVKQFEVPFFWFFRTQLHTFQLWYDANRCVLSSYSTICYSMLFCLCVWLLCCCCCFFIHFFCYISHVFLATYFPTTTLVTLESVLFQLLNNHKLQHTKLLNKTTGKKSKVWKKGHIVVGK